jgi:cytoskeletal protein RodZ
VTDKPKTSNTQKVALAFFALFVVLIVVWVAQLLIPLFTPEINPAQGVEAPDLRQEQGLQGNPSATAQAENLSAQQTPLPSTPTAPTVPPATGDSGNQGSAASSETNNNNVVVPNGNEQTPPPVTVPPTPPAQTPAQTPETTPPSQPTQPVQPVEPTPPPAQAPSELHISFSVDCITAVEKRYPVALALTANGTLFSASLALKPGATV